jgi:hypothetical protein
VFNDVNTSRRKESVCFCTFRLDFAISGLYKGFTSYQRSLNTSCGCWHLKIGMRTAIGRNWSDRERDGKGIEVHYGAGPILDIHVIVNTLAVVPLSPAVTSM